MRYSPSMKKFFLPFMVIVGFSFLTACSSTIAVPLGDPSVWKDGSGLYQKSTPLAQVDLSFVKYEATGSYWYGDEGLEKVFVTVTNHSTQPLLVSDENFFSAVEPGYMGKLPTQPSLPPGESQGYVLEKAPPEKTNALSAEQLITEAEQAVSNEKTSYAVTRSLNAISSLVSLPGALSGDKQSEHQIHENNETQTDNEVTHQIRLENLEQRVEYLKNNLLRKTTVDPGKSVSGLVMIPCYSLWKKFTLGADLGGVVTFPMTWKTVR